MVSLYNNCLRKAIPLQGVIHPMFDINVIRNTDDDKIMTCIY